MKLRDAFRLNRVSYDNHPYFVAYQDAAEIVIFNFTSYNVNKDHSCIIKPSEYSELTRDSVVAYQHGERIPHNKIDAFEQFVIRMSLKPISPSVLDKVILGATRSLHIPNGIRDLFVP